MEKTAPQERVCEKGIASDTVSAFCQQALQEMRKIGKTIEEHPAETLAAAAGALFLVGAMRGRGGSLVELEANLAKAGEGKVAAIDWQGRLNCFGFLSRTKPVSVTFESAAQGMLTRKTFPIVSQTEKGLFNFRSTDFRPNLNVPPAVEVRPLIQSIPNSDLESVVTGKSALFRK